MDGDTFFFSNLNLHYTYLKEARPGRCNSSSCQCLQAQPLLADAAVAGGAHNDGGGSWEQVFLDFPCESVVLFVGVAGARWTTVVGGLVMMVGGSLGRVDGWREKRTWGDREDSVVSVSRVLVVYQRSGQLCSDCSGCSGCCGRGLVKVSSVCYRYVAIERWRCTEKNPGMELKLRANAE